MGKKEILLLIIIVASVALIMLLVTLVCVIKLKRKKGKLSPEGHQAGTEAVSVGERPSDRQTGRIISFSGRCNGKETELGDGENIKLGRSSKECQIVVNGPKVSRLHCQITYHAGNDSYLVKDYSANGIFLLDGSRIAADRPEYVSAGTCICLGNKEQIFQLGTRS